MRLIDADVAKEMLKRHANEFSDVLSRKEKTVLVGGGTSCIDKCPTVDAVPVVHGRWETVSSMLGYLCCSNCKDVYIWETWLGDGKWNYCPNCGAKMDGGNEE